jgi:hypothetical protein
MLSYTTKNLQRPTKYPSTLCTVRNVATNNSPMPTSVHAASYPACTTHPIGRERR